MHDLLYIPRIATMGCARVGALVETLHHWRTLIQGPFGALVRFVDDVLQSVGLFVLF